VSIQHLVPDFVTLIGDRSVHKCTERSPKKSDEIRNQMLYRYN